MPVSLLWASRGNPLEGRQALPPLWWQQHSEVRLVPMTHCAKEEMECLSQRPHIPSYRLWAVFLKSQKIVKDRISIKIGVKRHTDSCTLHHLGMVDLKKLWDWTVTLAQIQLILYELSNSSSYLVGTSYNLCELNYMGFLLEDFMVQNGWHRKPNCVLLFQHSVLTLILLTTLQDSL